MQSILIGDLSKLVVSNNDFDDDCLVSNLQYVWAISQKLFLFRTLFSLKMTDDLMKKKRFEPTNF